MSVIKTKQKQTEQKIKTPVNPKLFASIICNIWILVRVWNDQDITSIMLNVKTIGYNMAWKRREAA